MSMHGARMAGLVSMFAIVGTVGLDTKADDLLGPWIRAEANSVAPRSVEEDVADNDLKERGPLSLGDEVNAATEAASLGASTVGLARASIGGGLGAETSAVFPVLGVPTDSEGSYSTATASYLRRFELSSEGGSAVPIDVTLLGEGLLLVTDDTPIIPPPGPAPGSVDGVGGGAGEIEANVRARVGVEVVLHVPLLGSQTLLNVDAALERTGSVGFEVSPEWAPFWSAMDINPDEDVHERELDVDLMLDDLFTLSFLDEFAVEVRLTSEVFVGSVGWIAESDFLDTIFVEFSTDTPGVTLTEVTVIPEPAVIGVMTVALVLLGLGRRGRSVIGWMGV